MPVTVRVCAADPAVTEEGDIEVAVGRGLTTVNVRFGVEVPPPGVGLVTETVWVPVVERSAVVSWMVNWLPEVRVVVLAEPS